jgi:hypothetical protein
LKSGAEKRSQEFRSCRREEGKRENRTQNTEVRIQEAEMSLLTTGTDH